MIDEGKKLLLGYTDIDILSNREFSIVQKYTFGAFYLHFLAETKKKFIEELGSIYNPDMFCNGIPELILSRLHAVCVRALIVEMSMYKAAGRLKGNNSGEEYEYFQKQFLVNQEMREELFQVYPLLKQNITRTISQSAKFLSDMWKRLNADRTEIEKNIIGGGPLGNIVSVSSVGSDFHCEGQCVLKIETDKGQKFLYKPRPVQTEKAFLVLLNHLYKGIGMNEYSYGCVLRENYGWVEYVEAESCMEPEQINRYFQRLGVSICLSYFLGTGDLHYENLIAHGEYPVPVDVEVFCTQAGGKDGTKEGYSVLFSGILPDPSRSTKVNILNGGEGQKASIKVARVINDKTSDMKIAYDYPEMPVADNQVMLNGSRISAAAYETDISDGFRKAYNFIMENKSNFTALFVKESLECRIRVLLENTQRYTMLLSGSGHPMVLQSAEKRRELLEHVYEDKNGLSLKEKQAVEYGIRDLEEGDIPYYFTEMNSHSLFTSRKEEIDEYFSLSLTDCFRFRMEKAGRLDCSRQEQIIRMVIELSGYGKEEFVNSHFPVKKVDKKQDPEKQKQFFLHKAMEIAAQIEKEALWDKDRQTVSWIEPLLAGVKEERIHIVDGDMYFYNGMSGIAVFLYSINRVSGKLKALCDAVKNTMFQYTDSCLRDRRRLLSENTGIFCGEASLCYSYQLLYRMTEDDIFLEYARKHAVLLIELLVKDTVFDLVYGNAGAILVLCGMYSFTQDIQYLKEAEKAGDIVAAHAVSQGTGFGWINKASQAVLAGMSHGNSGMIPGLIKLSYLLNTDKYDDLIIGCLEYEDSLYSEEYHNWADLRQEGDERYQACAWCHGFGGITASRLACLPYAGVELEQRLKQDLSRAESCFLSLQMRKGMCLCHGNLGMLLLLDKFMEYNSSSGLKYIKDLLVMATLDELEHSHIMPQEKYAKGMMNGMAGIGYACLKLAGVDSLPDIMLCDI